MADVRPDDGGSLLRPVVVQRAAAVGVELAEPPDIAIATVQARRGRLAELGTRVSALFGVDLIDRPKRIAGAEVAFVGIGPGRWWALRPGGGNAFAEGLALDLAGLAAVTDQADGWRLLRVAGPGARVFLARGVAIDLHPRVFGPGDAATTEIAHIGVTFWQVDHAPTYDIAVPRSYSGSFAHFLAATAASLAASARD